MSECEEIAVQTLRGKCNVIKEVLNKTNGLAESIIGLSPPPTDYDLREPAGTLESLANELVFIQDLAESVFEYLVRMDEMI